jgi:hypothetical protein
MPYDSLNSIVEARRSLSTRASRVLPNQVLPFRKIDAVRWRERGPGCFGNGEEAAGKNALRTLEKIWSRGTPLRGRGTPALSCPPPQ